MSGKLVAVYGIIMAIILSICTFQLKKDLSYRLCLENNNRNIEFCSSRR